MKKILLSLAALLTLAVVFSGCNSNSPKATAEKWLNAFYHMDYAKAKEFSTEDTKKQLESFESMMGMMQQSAKEEAKKIKVDVKDPVVEGDKATVEYTLSNDPSPKTLKLVKENGKWLAQWTKMDMGGNGDGAPGAGDLDNSGLESAPDTMMAPPADGTVNETAIPADSAVAH
jgi:hypothetical protein